MIKNNEPFSAPKNAPSPPVKIEVEDVSQAAKKFKPDTSSGNFISWITEDLPKALLFRGK